MKWILTNDSEVLCDELTTGLHGGHVKTAGTAKLTVNKAPVLVETDVVGQSVSGCQTAPPPQTNSKCLHVVTVTSPPSKASKLTAGGAPVLTEDLTGTTDGVPLGTLAADAKQDKLRSN